VFGALGRFPAAGAVQVIIADYLRERRERKDARPAIT
jgi:hypothetical protein